MRLYTDREAQRARVTSTRYGPGTVLTTGTSTPDNSIGKEGDLYHRLDSNGIAIEEHQMQSGAYVKLADINAAYASFTPVVTTQTGAAPTVIDSGSYYRLLGNKVITLFLNTSFFTVPGTGYIQWAFPTANTFFLNADSVGIGTDGTKAIFITVGQDGTHAWYRAFNYDGTSPIQATPFHLIATVVYTYQ